MVFTVQDTLDIIEGIAPAELAEEWDNVGLMIGSPSAPVETVLLGLDPTLQLLDEAIENNTDLLITHHPFIFHPLRSVDLGIPEGIFVERAIKHKINVISCHTNLDSAAEGVSNALARKLGLEQIKPLEPGDTYGQCGLGSIGRYRDPVDANEFVDRLRQACSPPWLLATPNRPDAIECVAVCGGSGSELAAKARQQGAQVYVTAEVKHSIARWAEEAGLWLIDGGHFATENQALADLRDQLQGAVGERAQKITIRISTRQRPPLGMV